MKARNPIIHFEKIDSVNNPNSMHGIYPYRGKISAIDAQNIIRQLPSKGTILDPFCGSGTIVYEGQRHGLKAIGVDNNPLAVQLSKAKIHKEVGNSIEECKYLIEMAKKDFDSKNYEKMPEGPLKSFHEQTASEIMCMKNYYESMNDYLKGVFFGAIALAARGCNGYVWTSSTVGKNIEPNDILISLRKCYQRQRNTLSILILLNAKLLEYSGDSRKLSEMIEPHSIDFVFTSPPYFDGLDYTAYYGKLVYEIFGIES